jgi:hypothetical protein
MNFEAWITSQVTNGRDATISLALLEKAYPDEVPALRAIQHWADQICRKIGCTAIIHFASDVVTFYPTKGQP